MLKHKYAIPVLIGICLGIIVTGVQISYNALNAALGDYKGQVRALSEWTEGSGVIHQDPAKNMDISPNGVSRPEMFMQAFREATGGLRRMSPATERFFEEKVDPACRSVYETLDGLFSVVAHAVN
ncbi:MAG: hypothetical protein ACOY31_02855 [Bacillota bacterium]